MTNTTPDITGIYEVGGHVRDHFLGLVSKDIDYAIECGSFKEMHDWVKLTHQKVFVVKPEYLTIRALTHTGEPRDYVMCRKDGAYSDARRPDSVEPGTIYDDLARRDFTVNAIARDVRNKTYLDPHGGIEDLNNGRLRCVGDTNARFNEDSLRILRAIRFSITKSLTPDANIQHLLAGNDNLLDHWVERLNNLAESRRLVELNKCFYHDTPKTIEFLHQSVHPKLTAAVLGDIWLRPTTAKR